MMTKRQIQDMRDEILGQMWKCPCVGNCPKCRRNESEIAVIDRILA